MCSFIYDIGIFIQNITALLCNINNESKNTIIMFLAMFFKWYFKITIPNNIIQHFTNKMNIEYIMNYLVFLQNITYFFLLTKIQAVRT